MTRDDESEETNPWAPRPLAEAASLEQVGPIPEFGVENVVRSAITTNVKMTLFANVATTIIAVGTGILAARLLGPVGEGKLAAIQTWPMLLGSLAMLGLP